jgi:hypothetical protein
MKDTFLRKLTRTGWTDYKINRRKSASAKKKKRKREERK